MSTARARARAGGAARRASAAARAPRRGRGTRRELPARRLSRSPARASWESGSSPRLPIPRTSAASTRPSTRSPSRSPRTRPAHHHPLRADLHRDRALVGDPRVRGTPCTRTAIRRRARAIAARGTALSLGFHESQSRLWENWVGRARAVPGAASSRPCERSSRHLRRRLGRAAPPGRQPGRAVAHPGRGRRGDLQPPHHPSLRARGRDLQRGDSSRPTSPRRGTRGCATTSASRCPTTPTGCSRTCTGRGRLRLLPHLLAGQRDRRPALGAGHSRAAGPGGADRARRARRRSATGCASASTRTAPSSSPPR